ncbi:MAG: chromosome segregation protein SMC [Bacteroidetes bacterium]|nr:chromosome segregation protein SMC [Bacteroidota bacterium]
MYLSKLEIFGFKSFADKTTIEFDSGVSAVVGPNGSGKSNIVDAMRWVLGEQGDKALRSQKREDVVFNGTRFRKPLSVAEVALTIQNNRGLLPTEYSEVQIARRFFRSGETEYFLNGTQVRLKDIKELFADTGIGPDAYSVIELKMVETILSNVKNERRKLFEEASGIVTYKHNRDLTYNRLESVKETLSRVNDIIREKQRTVNALERQLKRNEEAKNVSEELRVLELKVYKVDYDSLIAEIENIKANEGSNIDLKNQIEIELKQNDTILDNLRNELKEIDTQMANYNNDLQNVREQINFIERENLVNTEKSKNLTNDINRITEDNDRLEATIERNTTTHEELENKTKVLQNTLIMSEDSLKEKKVKVDETIKVITEKKNELVGFGSKMKEINKLVNTKKIAYEKNKSSYDANLNQLEKLSSGNKDSLMMLDELQSNKNTLEDELKPNLEKLRVAENTLRDKENEKTNLTAKISEKEKQVNEKRIALQNIKAKADALKNLIDSFDDYSEGIKYLIKDKGIKNLTTIVDAIDVEDKFKIAIETALGEVSNYVIANDSNDMDAILRSLEESKKGKVTFILNDKLLESYKQNFYFEDYTPDFIGEKGVYGIADKFVKSKKDEYLILMKYILDEFVIVDTVETAKRLSKGNYYKFITLDGDIFTEGFIRSGSETNKEGLKLGREKQIQKLDDEYKEYNIEVESDLKDLEQLTAANNEIDIKVYKKNVDELRKSCDDLELEIQKIDNKREILNKQLNESEAGYNSISETNKSLLASIDILIKEVADAEAEQNNAERQLSFLTDEFNEVEQEYSKCSVDYNSFNVEVTKLRNELKNEEEHLKRMTSTLENSRRQLAKNNETLALNEKQIEDLKSKIESNASQLNEYKEEEKIISRSYNEVKAAYETKEAERYKIDLEQRQKRIDFDRISQGLVDAQVKIRENQVRAEQMVDYIKKKYEIQLEDYTGKPEPKAKETKKEIEEAIESEVAVEISSDDSEVLQDEVIEELEVAKSEELESVSAPVVEEVTVQEPETAEEPEEEFNLYDAKRRVDELSERLKRLGGYQEMLFADFENDRKELDELVKQRDDLLESEKDIRKTIDKINKEARERFLNTFNQIRENFIDIFKQLFSEGDEADLKMIFEQDEEGKVDDDPLEAKIEITAKPRGKRPTSIELLSGGEKTLTAIALLFAIYLVKPSPFCILDEVDAPLDVANLGRFNNMIRRFSDKTQFILITHNERTMETVDRLYGVTMQEPGVTTIVETRFKD